MDIRTLRYFVEVVRQQSFTRAAERLFVTQPTISKMLKNLEDELNCTLLIRDGRKLLLTDTGRVVILDSRLLTRRYGKRIIDALPPFRRVIG